LKAAKVKKLESVQTNMMIEFSKDGATFSVSGGDVILGEMEMAHSQYDPNQISGSDFEMDFLSRPELQPSLPVAEKETKRWKSIFRNKVPNPADSVKPVAAAITANDVRKLRYILYDLFKCCAYLAGFNDVDKQYGVVYREVEEQHTKASRLMEDV
jgi:hypothetical protein